jgi:hypothetical protein
LETRGPLFELIDVLRIDVIVKQKGIV